MQILQHFLPSQDLTLVNLKRISEDLGSATTGVEAPGRESTTQHDVENENDEVGDLHSQLGCLMEDSLGEYRKYAKSSTYEW
jgi:hypothetical protein